MNWPIRLTNLAGILTLALGTLVLLGWYLHEPALIQVNPAFVPMQYNTALGFVLGGLALLGLAWSWPRLAAIAGFAVLLVGLLTLIEYILGLDLHIDQLFMRHYIDIETSHPGRMAPNTALCFSLTGLAALITSLRRRYVQTPTWTATLGAIIIGLGIVALAGYIIGVESAYGWGHLTRMAIHTAAGFIALGFGFTTLAWSWSRRLRPEDRLPRWLPPVIGITGFTVTFAMWQALVAQEQRLISEMGAHAASYADEGLLVFGILLTLVLAIKAWAVAKAGRDGRTTGGALAPFVVIALGALLAFSLYSLLKTNFEASVRLRFESEVRNHVEAIERGIEAYTETLHHIRSEFDALSFVDRSQFRRLTTRDLQRLPGIMALEWVPLVPDHERETMEAMAREEVSADFVFGDDPTPEGMTAAPRRERYFPIYYAEPQAPNLPVMGFDLATRPGHYAELMKAARTNTPVVSSRLQLYQSEKGSYSVFVALPVYRKGMPLDTAGNREVALRGFAVMVIEIGPMLGAILDNTTSPAGLSLTFENTGAGDEKAFMYRHVSRKLELGPGNRESDFLDDGLTSSTTLAFADRHWQLTAHAANRKIYPDWDADNLWLPLGMLLLSFGLAYFLYRIKLAEAELNASMQRFKVLFDQAADAYLIFDGAGFADCNQAAVDLLGYSHKEELLALNPAELSPELQPDGERSDLKAETMVAAAYSQGGNRFDWIHRKRGGEALPVEVALTPIEQDGKPVLLTVWHDLTERHKAEEEIKRINFLSDIALELTDSGYWHVDYSDPDYYYQSERAANILGEPLKEDGRYHLQDEWFSRLIEANPETAERTAERYQGAIDGKYASYDSIYAYRRPIDGKIVWVHAVGKIVRDENDKIRYMYGAYQDITEQHRVQQELNIAKEAADAANQAKSAFLANMSHELRTPMNAILGYSEMLIEEAEDLEQEEFIPDLKKINQAGNHLLSLINDVLDLSKIESGKMEAFAETFDVGALLDQVSGTAQPLMTNNGNHFKVERGEHLGKACQDVTKLRQSLLNLLSNAAKFTHEGTITLRAERESQAESKWLTLSVSDTGIGIPADKLDHVFEEFSQADNSTTRDYGGTGLGLAISRRFCRMLGGDLSVTSELGVGSTFTIRLPAVLAGAEEPQAVSQQPESAKTQTADEPGTATHGKIVLVIDDDAESCDIIQRFLEKDGFKVVTALSGEEGLRLAHKLKPAAITLDVMMPDMDGWSVLRALKVDPVLHDIPVVMLSMLDDKSKGYALGATDYLTKPVDREQLHNALARYYIPGEPCSVLLVEDDQATREMMARTLEKAEWQILEAGNGREALDQLAQQKPRLILLDLMMPVMDGFDFLLEMRANADWQDIPVIVLTAKDLTDEDRRMLSGRVEQIIEKGADSHEQVVNLIHKIIDPALPPAG